MSFTAGKASGGLKGTETTREGGKMHVFSGKIRGNADRERQNEHFKGKT